MSADSLQKPLRTLGVTPWQAIVAIALAGFYLGEMKPKLAAGEKLTTSVDKLTETVSTLTTKVEIHAVLLANVAEIKLELREMRQELIELRRPKTAAAAH